MKKHSTHSKKATTPLAKRAASTAPITEPILANTSAHDQITATRVHPTAIVDSSAKHSAVAATHSNAHDGGHGHGQSSEKTQRSYFLFWVYLMTDLLMFAGLFAAFAALRNSTFGGPGEKELFSLPLVMSETLILLVSSYTSGLAVYFATKGKTKATLGFLYATGILGASFLALELTEFVNLIRDGNSYTHSAFLSSYFSLVGTHGLHIAVGLLWLTILLVFIARRGLVENMVRKITFFSTFWHFLDLVWIFIFSFVYIMGVSR